MGGELVVRVAVPVPVRRLFDYLAPANTPAGVRVQVPFGRGRAVGVVVEAGVEPGVDTARLKPVARVLDERPLLPEDTLALVSWAARYYRHPPGEAFQHAIPGLLRGGRDARTPGEPAWSLTAAGREVDPASLAARAPRQAAVLARLREAGRPLTATALAEEDGGRARWREARLRLEQKGMVERAGAPAPEPAGPPEPGPALNAAQAAAVDAVCAALDRHETFLLHGVTGSGKTEVYLHLVQAVLAAGRQALVLVPEIGLTPQLVDRFRRRLGVAVGVLHSGMADGERLAAWLAAGEGRLPVIIGTRSAVFTPLARPGLVVVDEEHDPALKQQEGFRYSARDLAILRAARAGVPVVLGSGTPSLEMLALAEQGRARRLELPERAGAARPPRLELVDLRNQPLDAHLAPRLRQAAARHLAAGRQVLLFLNRRGFAPVLMCHACGWQADCPRCDTHLTLHRREARLRCHHCGTERPAPAACPACGAGELLALGAGTQRIEEQLAALFPGHEVVRIDRDSTRRRGALEAALERARAGRGQILLGTQMLAKGHHFPNVTLVGVVDADQGLFSTDFRGPERMAQLILQVAGRAGRGEHPGEVLIQTHHPDHPLLQALISEGYAAFARRLMEERRAAALPPYAHLVLLRAEAAAREAPAAFLARAAELAAPAGPEVTVMGPVPAPMERRAGRWRAQLLLQSSRRGPLQRLLDALLPELEAEPAARRVRWSVDVDPQEMF